MFLSGGVRGILIWQPCVVFSIQGSLVILCHCCVHFTRWPPTGVDGLCGGDVVIAMELWVLKNLAYAVDSGWNTFLADSTSKRIGLGSLFGTTWNFCPLHRRTCWWRGPREKTGFCFECFVPLYLQFTQRRSTIESALDFNVFLNFCPNSSLSVFPRSDWQTFLITLPKPFLLDSNWEMIKSLLAWDM